MSANTGVNRQAWSGVSRKDMQMERRELQEIESVS